MHNKGDSIGIEELLYETDVCRQEGEFDEAIAGYFNILNRIKLDENLYSIHGSRCLKQLSYCYRKKRDVSNAVLYAKQAVDLAKRINSQDESQAHRKSLGICYMHIGSIYDEIKEYFKAMIYYKKGCQCLEKVYGKDTNEYSVLANALISLGTVYYNLLDFKNAAEIFRRTKEILGDNHSDIRYVYAERYLSEIEHDFDE